jgi:hypothetical protein
MTNKQQQEVAINELNNILKDIQTDTIYTVLRHVSSSGMQREISVKMIDAGRIIHLDYLVSTALNMKVGKHNGIVVKGCGMDMGFHIVHNILRAVNPSKQFRHEWI